MAEKFRDSSSKARRGETASREELQNNWAQMAASMVSPSAQSGGRGSNGGGPAPLPVSALPVPDDEPDIPEEQPKHFDLPRNAKGELTPAQRARLGLDLETSSDDPAAQSAAQAPQAPPAGQPLQPPSQQSAPRAQPQAAAAPERQKTDEPTPEPLPETEVVESSQQQPGSAFDFRGMEQEGADAPALQPVDAEPRLAPVSDSGPKLAPARNLTAPADRTPQKHAPEQPSKRQSQSRRSRDDDDFRQVTRDRNVLSYGVAWTAFCVVITGILSFTSSMSGDPTAAAGPGPLIPGLLSIALGWIVVIAARGMGNGWWVLMIVPAAVLLVGPYVYKNVWAGGVQDAARSYLSTNGAAIQIDVDATSVVSATKNTNRGCFAINRTRSNYDSEVAVVTYQPETARQQADFALAPRYAGRIEAGGERATYRVFTFKSGRAPAIVTTPTAPPLDCEKSTSAPGTGAKRVDDG